MTGDLVTAYSCRAVAVAAVVFGVWLAVAGVWWAAGVVWFLVPSLLLVSVMARLGHNRRKAGRA